MRKQFGNMPNLSTLRGQQAIAAYIEQADLIIIDNISTLCGHAKENEADDDQEDRDREQHAGQNKKDKSTKHAAAHQHPPPKLS